MKQPRSQALSFGPWEQGWRETRLCKVFEIL